MKNRLFAIILSALLLSAVACGCSGRTTQTSQSSVISESSVRSESPIAESSVQNSSAWQIKYFVDDFGDETNEPYIYYKSTGTFSNSATDNSPLTAVFIIEKDSVAIKLFEYSNSLVKNSYSKIMKFDVKIKLTDGSTKSYTGNMYSSGDRIQIDSSFNLITQMWTDKEIKFHIVNSGRPTSTYDFTINPSGFYTQWTEYRKLTKE